VYPGDIFKDTLDKNMLRSVNDPDQAFLNPNILTGRGYAVLFPSMPMVAEGPGVAGEPYSHMLDGVTPAIDTVIARGIADSTRLGIMGHSYGGYAVNCIVSQTHRFRAAFSSAGPADLTSFVLQYAPSSRYTNLPAVWLPWAESGQGRMGLPPWQDPERYRRNSPLMHVDSVHTPILISVGDDDDIGQEEEWFTALERAGKRARLLRYWGEGHWLLSPANTRHLWNEILQWFDTYLQP
jgi:dipeptidyl aminopeptidase/acylaminoacyl peptidase